MPTMGREPPQEGSQQRKAWLEGITERRAKLNPDEMILLLNPAMAEDIISLEFSVNEPISSFYC